MLAVAVGLVKVAAAVGRLSGEKDVPSSPPQAVTMRATTMAAALKAVHLERKVFKRFLQSGQPLTIRLRHIKRGLQATPLFLSSERWCDHPDDRGER
ncbi:MAG: hypothetical protein IIC82_02660 [Chloroflexi bacterium]|nr:hypothetical protein [Chloroflexota bacterium]